MACFVIPDVLPVGFAGTFVVGLGYEMDEAAAWFVVGALTGDFEGVAYFVYWDKDEAFPVVGVVGLACAFPLDVLEPYRDDEICTF